MAAQKLTVVDFEVFGRVQGVFFRKYTQDEARKLGVRGWCMNTYHGTVAGQLEGPQDKVKIIYDHAVLVMTNSPASTLLTCFQRCTE